MVGAATKVGSDETRVTSMLLICVLAAIVNTTVEALPVHEPFSSSPESAVFPSPHLLLFSANFTAEMLLPSAAMVKVPPYKRSEPLHMRLGVLLVDGETVIVTPSDVVEAFSVKSPTLESPVEKPVNPKRA